jgi:GNAT superfamily N-acetyltransferase
MEIFELQDTEEETLLCLNFDFSKDWETDREEAFKPLGRAKDVKRFWNYNTLFKGVRVLVAYEGASPVGHLEYIPIEAAPRPVKGENLLFIDCLFVEPQKRWHGVGAHLLDACEAKAREQHLAGLAVIAFPDSLYMPAGFFVEHGFVVAQESDCAWLLMKTWQTVTPPEFMPRRYQPHLVPGKTTVDVFWCSQCPFWAHARDELMKVAHELGGQVAVREINTDDRAVLEQYGIANGVFINGECAFLYPPGKEEIRKALQVKLN